MQDKKFYRLERDRLAIHGGLITVEIYWPKLYAKTKHFGIYFDSQFSIRAPNDWSWKWSFVFRVIGFGAGIAYNHCQNPNYIAPEYRP